MLMTKAMWLAFLALFKDHVDFSSVYQYRILLSWK